MNDFFIFASSYGKNGSPRPSGALMMSLAYEHINEVTEELSAGETESDSGGCNAIPLGAIVLSILALFMLPYFKMR